MKISVGCMLAVLVLFGCGKKSEVKEGPLTHQVLNRHLVELGPVRYTADDGWNWTCERVYVIIRQSSTDAEVRVYEKGNKKIPSVRGARYDASSRNATYRLVRDSVNDDWYIDTSEGEPIRKFGILKIRLALRTGEFVEEKEPVRTAKRPEPAEHAPAEPAKESDHDDLQITEVKLDPEASVDELRDALRLINENLLREEPLTLSDVVVTKDGKDIKCEILSETAESVRIRTEIGAMTVSRERIISLRYAPPQEQARALQAKSDIEAMQQQKTEIEARIRELDLASQASPPHEGPTSLAKRDDSPSLREEPAAINISTPTDTSISVQQSSGQKPVQEGDNLIENGDFSDGLRLWNQSHSSNVPDNWQITVEGNEKYLSLFREQSRNDSGTVGVHQELDADVTGFNKIILSLDVRILRHTLKNSGWWAERKGGSGEYPVKVLVYYRDAAGTANIWTHGFISEFQGETTLANFTRVPAGEWFHYEADLKNTAELIDMDYTRRGEPLPEPAGLTAIKILGGGWDFAAIVDNVELRGEM